MSQDQLKEIADMEAQLEIKVEAERLTGVVTEKINEAAGKDMSLHALAWRNLYSQLTIDKLTSDRNLKQREQDFAEQKEALLKQIDRLAMQVANYSKK
jgi:hypothetical protein